MMLEDIGAGVQLVKKAEPEHIPEWAVGFMVDTKDVAHLMSAGLLVLRDKDGHTAVIGSKGVFGSKEKFDEFVDKCRRMRDD